MRAPLLLTIAVVLLASAAGCRQQSGQKVPTLPETEAAPVIPPTAASDQALRRELLRLAQDEEATRTALAQTATPDPSLITRRRDFVTSYAARLDDIIAGHGWPALTLVGDDGARAAWALAQNAAEDPPFQKRCLEAMKQAPTGAVPGIFLAYLEDRVRHNEGRLQYYGTLLEVVNGKVRALPIEDEKNVDDRRKAAGLEPLAHFISYSQMQYLNRLRAQSRQGGSAGR